MEIFEKGWVRVSLSVVFSAGLIYATVRGLPSKVEANAVMSRANDKEIALLRNDFTYIKKGIDDIRKHLHVPITP